MKRAIEEKTQDRYQTIVKMGFNTEQGLGAENRPLLCHTVAEGDMQQLKFLLEQENKPDIY